MVSLRCFMGTADKFENGVPINANIPKWLPLVGKGYRLNVRCSNIANNVLK